MKSYQRKSSKIDVNWRKSMLLVRCRIAIFLKMAALWKNSIRFGGKKFQKRIKEKVLFGGAE